MGHVWMVEAGSYSDYRVVAVCSTQQKAERIRSIVGSDASVRRVVLDPIGPDRDGVRLYCVLIADDGAITDDWHGEYLGADDLSDPRQTRAWIGRPNAYENSPRLRVWTWAKSRKHAEKVAADMRRALMASGAWRADPHCEQEVL